jgi:hypothetical protein
MVAIQAAHRHHLAQQQTARQVIQQNHRLMQQNLLLILGAQEQAVQIAASLAPTSIGTGEITTET